MFVRSRHRNGLRLVWGLGLASLGSLAAIAALTAYPDAQQSLKIGRAHV